MQGVIRRKVAAGAGSQASQVSQAQPAPSDASGSNRWWWPTRIPPTSVIEFIRPPEGSLAPHEHQDQVFLQDGQPLVHIEVGGQRMVSGQPVWALRADLEHHA